jgi:hypothetical protein
VDADEAMQSRVLTYWVHSLSPAFEAVKQHPSTKTISKTTILPPLTYILTAAVSSPSFIASSLPSLSSRSPRLRPHSPYALLLPCQTLLVRRLEPDCVKGHGDDECSYGILVTGENGEGRVGNEGESEILTDKSEHYTDFVARGGRRDVACL